MKIRKLLCLTLVLCIILCTAAVPGIVSADGIAPVLCYSPVEDAGFMAGGAWDNGTSCAYDYTDEIHNKAYHVTAASGSTWPFSQFTVANATSGKTITDSVIGVSFQTKVVSDNSDFLVFDMTAGSSDKSFFKAGFGSGQTYAGNNYDYAATSSPFEGMSGKWIDFDVIINQTNKTVTVYKDGAEFWTNGGNGNFFDDAGLSSISTIYTILFAWNADGKMHETWLDNLKCYEAGKSDFYIVNSNAAADGSIYLDLSASLAANVGGLSGIQLVKSDSGEAVETTAEIYEKQIIKLIPSQTLEPGSEYVVTVPDGIKDILGRSLKSDIVIYKAAEPKTKVLVDTDFSDPSWRAFEGNPAWYENNGLPTGWSQPWYGGWGGVNEIGTADLSGNRVLKFNAAESSRMHRAINYDLSAIPDNCTLNISYKSYLHSEIGKAYLQPLFVTQADTNAWLLTENYYNSNDGHSGGMSVSAGSSWEMHGGRTVVPEADFKFDEWYTVNAKYVIDGVSNAKASYEILDSTGAVVATVNDINVSNGCIKPKAFSFDLYYNNFDAANYLYVDDVKISYTYEANTVKSLRLVNLDGETLMPSAQPLNDINKFNVTFAKNASEVSAVLSSEAGEVTLNTDGSGNAYTFTLSEILTAGVKYTLTVNFDGEQYLYEFTPSGANKVVISDFNLYKGETPLENLTEVSKGDVITAKAKLINLTGSEKPACLTYAVYKDGFLKAFNLENGTVTLSADGVTLEKSFAITDELSGCERISAFLWSDVKSLVPLTKSVNLR